MQATGTGKSDIYLHLQTKRAGKIKGESKTAGHVDDIHVQSWMWGVTGHSAAGSVQATGRRSYTALTIFKTIDLATTALMSALATNDEVKEAKLTMRKSGGDPLDYFTIQLAGARIEQVNHEVSATGEARERVDIVFSKLDVEYKQQDAAGRLVNNVSFADEILPA
ncbi:MAG: type VI secretion system tube protein Hcp [Betaproteobacteria bacterium]|nr:type VI secretion system tube protein Hcp [Betaproteobacteria bacterium]